ncbi:MAG: hypothetical protein J6V06_04955 [Clostridia bacterium]|nr:hypothetical protein [Clostridia bacterium]
MANHRPKSLSELNNVYDKAMRAERAIKEGSDMLSIPEPDTAPESENIFQQLENKAAEAHKNQAFDPDITNIANDFLKRYAQSEKPKAPVQEIKRPAPSIQVYHTPVKEPEKKADDVPLNTGSNFADYFSAPEAPVYKPAHEIPTVRETVPEVPAQQPPVQTAVPAPTVQKVAAAPAVKAPTATKVAEPEATPVKAQPETKFDHTPRPAPSRVRITSTERSELMEEYMRVMSDDDDEPSTKKSVFSFFKKKKKYDDDDFDTADELFDSYDESDENSAEESDTEYVDEYSNSPEENDTAETQESMDLYDYMEADLDFDAEDEYEEDEDSALDISFMSVSAPKEDITYDPQEVYQNAEAVSDMTDESEGEIQAVTEETPAFEEVAEEAETAQEETEEAVIYPEEEAQTAEDEVVYPDAPPAGMVFEDVFSVSDESKRSHTGGNWTEVFDEELPESLNDEAEEIICVPEELDEAEEISQETVVYPTEETVQETAEEIIEEEPQQNEAVIYPTEEAEETFQDYPTEATESDGEEAEEAEEDFDDYDAPKKRTGLKILMSIAVVICFIAAAATAIISGVFGVDTGKAFSGNLRAFSVPETEAIGLNKGDLVITENVYAQADDLYVFVNQATHTYDFGKVTASTTNLSGDYLYITQTADGVQLINRDLSMGVIVAKYSSVGSVLSVICDYSILIIVSLVIFIAALIVCLVIITRKRRLYEEASAIYDHMERSDNDDDDGSDDNNSDESNNDDEYYGDYDTDGIEQGLFSGI